MEFQAIYRKLLVCKEIVYKNNYGNCISNDTNVLTVSSKGSGKPKNIDSRVGIFEIEFDYFDTVNEDIGKFDQHLNAFIASKIETQIIATIQRNHQRECEECINVFEENTKIDDELIALKSKGKDFSNSHRHPCKSTIDIIKATNKIFQLIDQQTLLEANRIYDKILHTVISYLYIDELYEKSDFNLHTKARSSASTVDHHEQFIYKIVNEYMKMKSKRIGSRISEEEQGIYIRHNNKKRIHESGQ